MIIGLRNKKSSFTETFILSASLIYLAPISLIDLYLNQVTVIVEFILSASLIYLAPIYHLY